ncbi:MULTISPECIES: hypothetical protein [unclassified Burkholderia]|uniref:hypothetical protein n=1 Tax=unclassified Burkholderia TaxID=2613784 RepID=UPI0011991E2B|nr:MULTISPECIES: hypothetical protein [unclassified Burkholderia]TWC57518.1 hypothetical protein FB600_14214 [Burkholderia sp. SJZ089]TWC92489.1 hypothetical protein FBX98_14214 [Burkholderia sp. SJZ115]TWC95493.1 hypothetical protein FB601_14214 [Burkholderia sp. SJZ091]
MNPKIFGRKVGTNDAVTQLVTPRGGSNDDPNAAAGMLVDHLVESARAAVTHLREGGYEGYVVFPGDPTHYGFTPEADFVYPAAAD